MSQSLPVQPAPQTVPPRRRRLRWLWWVAGLLLLATLTTLGISVYVGWNVTHPPRKPFKNTPAAVGLTYEDVTFQSRVDGTRLSGWYLPATGAGSDRSIVIAHGFQGNRASAGPDLVTVAQILTGQGYNVLMFDFRASGESDGDAITVGYKETWDLSAAVDFVKARGARKIGLLGFSMGATTSLLTAAELPEVNAVIADAGFTDLGLMIEENATHWTKLPTFPFSYVIKWVMPPLLGSSDLSGTDALARMDKLSDRPVLFIHGDADKSIDVHHGKDLYQAYVKAGGKQGDLWIVPGAGHTKSFNVATKEYTAKMLAFFGQHLR